MAKKQDKKRAVAKYLPAVLAPLPSAPATAGVVMGKSGRDTWDDQFQSLGTIPFVITPPSSNESAWQSLKLDDNALNTMSPERLLTMMVDLAPDLSRGLWDFIRLFNPGHKVACYVPGTNNMTADTKAWNQLHKFFDHLDDRHGSIETLYSRLAAGCFLRGAFFAELVMDEDGRTPIDLAIPDPSSVRFQKSVDPVYGQIYRFGQYQGGLLRLFDTPLVRYVPVDPMPGSPYGRSLCSPSLFVCLSKLGFIHDIRRVIAQQGWPRHDITVKSEGMSNQVSENNLADPEYVKNWIDKTIAEVVQDYGDLQPDEAFVHTDAIEINKPLGAVDASSMGAVEPIMRFFDREAVKALKTMPIMMGMNEGSTETNANRQWEIQANSIQRMQSLCGTMLERLYELALQAQGIVTVVKISWDEIRSAEAQRDEQVFALRLANATAAYNAGFWTQEQASLHAVMLKPAEVKPLEIVPPVAGEKVPGTTVPDQKNPEPGSTLSERPHLRAVEDAA